MFAAESFDVFEQALYGGMIGAGVGALNGNTTSGMLIGAGVGGMIDQLEDDQPSSP